MEQIWHYFLQFVIPFACSWVTCWTFGKIIMYYVNKRLAKDEDWDDDLEDDLEYE